jgi:energy-coupling factor transporter ATP-binding protein EcfA2
VTADVIQTQFLNALHADYKLSPEHAQLQESGEWAAIPTRESLRELGEKIIATVPAERRKDYGEPILEGFNNLCFKLEDVHKALKKPAFLGRYVTAVGKTEWADVKWNDNTIAEKKNIINKSDFVFTAAESVANYRKGRDALLAGGVNARLLDCSDAHHYSTSKEKDRLGNCCCWVKGEPVFETLRQALFDFENRVSVDDVEPLMPLLRIEEMLIRFPAGTQLKDDEQSMPFCFRGEHRYLFSPYLTCFVGGRGAGKSTILNLLHEKLQPGQNPFFQDHWLDPEGTTSIATGVSVDGDKEKKEVEFILQNEVEQFAKDPARLTSAVFGRLQKLDQSGALSELLRKADTEKNAADRQAQRLRQLAEAKRELADKVKELERNRALVQSFTNEDYRAFSATLSELNRRLQSLKAGRERYEALLTGITDLLANPVSPASVATTIYEQRISALRGLLEQALAGEPGNIDLTAARAEEVALAAAIVETRSKLDGFLQARGLSVENQSDVGKATERVAVLGQQIPRVQQNIDQLGAEVGKFASARDLPGQFMQAVRERLAPINADLQNLGTEVKPIVLSYEFDCVAMNAKVRELVLTRLGTDERIRTDHLERVFEKVDFSEPVAQADLLAQLRDDGKTAKIVRDFFADELNYKLVMLEAWKLRISFPEFQRIHVTYDGRPIENSSFGQRCTAAIVILISLGNNPIVIDEPEAHLDSGLIARYLVGLIKRVKHNRQIIFATHNANFVVNGDAELIHILDMGLDHQTVAKDTTIENIAHRDRLLALEGGREAFRLRERRYGIGDIRVVAQGA